MLHLAVNISQIVLAFIFGPAFLWFLWEYLKQVKSIKTELKEVVKEVRSIHVELGSQKATIKTVEDKVEAANDKVDTVRESFDIITRNLQGTLDDRNLRLSHIERKTDTIIQAQASISQKLTNQEYQFQKLRSILK